MPLVYMYLIAFHIQANPKSLVSLVTTAVHQQHFINAETNIIRRTSSQFYRFQKLNPDIEYWHVLLIEAKKEVIEKNKQYLFAATVNSKNWHWQVV